MLGSKTNSTWFETRATSAIAYFPLSTSASADDSTPNIPHSLKIPVLHGLCQMHVRARAQGIVLDITSVYLKRFGRLRP